MIRNILICTMLSTVIIFSATVSYAQPWGEIGTSWVYQELPNPGYLNYLEYEITKDTVFDFIPCKKIEIHRHRYAAFAPTGETQYLGKDNNISQIFLRNSNDSIYYKYFEDWRFLFDFNFQEGDAFEFSGIDTTFCLDPDTEIFSIPIPQTGYMEVTEIQNNVNLGGSEVDLIYVNTDSGNWELGAYIIRGIGANRSMLPQPFDVNCPVPVLNMPLATESLVCYYSPSQGSFFSESMPSTEICDKVVSSVPSIEFDETRELVIFPNPVNEKLFVYQFGQSIPSNYSIYSINGMLLKEGKLSNTIDVSFLKSGMYFILTEKGKKIIHTKFIKR